MPEPVEVPAEEPVLRLVHKAHVKTDTEGNDYLSSQAMIFPAVDVDDLNDGVSVYVESGVEALGRDAADLVGSKTFDEVWRLLAGEATQETGRPVIEDEAELGFWADPAHALILRPATSKNQVKKISRRLARRCHRAAPL